MATVFAWVSQTVREKHVALQVGSGALEYTVTCGARVLLFTGTYFRFLGLEWGTRRWLKGENTLLHSVTAACGGCLTHWLFHLKHSNPTPDPLAIQMKQELQVLTHWGYFTHLLFHLKHNTTPDPLANK
jgi:hypothetical protein